MVDWRDRVCILIAGRAAYTGSHRAKALARSGYYSVVVDDLRAGHQSAVRCGPFIETHLAVKAALREAFESYPIAAALCFDASAYIGESMQAPQLYFQYNARSALCLIETMRDHGGVTLTAFSCGASCHPTATPITQERPKQLLNSYGEFKLTVERVLFWYAPVRGLQYVILSYFNAVEADPDRELGEMREPEPLLTPRGTDAVFGSRPTENVYGTDYDTEEGTALRIYIYVTELTKVDVAAMHYLESRGAPAACNFGTGKVTRCDN